MDENTDSIVRNIPVVSLKPHTAVTTGKSFVNTITFENEIKPRSSSQSDQKKEGSADPRNFQND